jgi:hypothetical protein
VAQLEEGWYGSRRGGTVRGEGGINGNCNSWK